MRAIDIGLLILMTAGHAEVIAADLYGKVWISPGSKPAINAKVKISCPNGSSESSVDKYGRYRLTKLPANNNCQLSIKHDKDTSGEVNVYSGTGSKSMNIELRGSGQELKVIVH